jgi:hypothetical protein
MAEAQTLTRHDLEAKIVKHSWEDEGFRAEFVADPAGAFTRYLEIPAAGLPKIVVHEEGAGSWHIVLPARPTNMSELSEQDLERVAGGGEVTEALYWTIASAIYATLSASVSGASAVAAQGIDKFTEW